MATLLGIEACHLLSKYDLPWVKTIQVDNISRLNSFKLPFYLKAISSRAIHKTESKAIVKVESKDQIEKEFNRLRKIGVVIAQENFNGIEVLIGAKNDPTFGKVVVFGLGGIFVEVLKDVSFRIAPLTQKDAREMIQEIKGYRLLKGYRGKKANLSVLETALVNMGKLAVKEDIKEVDINPFIVDKNRGYAVDTRIVL